MRDLATIGEARVADTVTLSPDLAFFPLDDDLVAFSERAQSLIGLNTTAAFLVRKLQEGTPVLDLTGALGRKFAVTDEQADGWVTSTLEALDSHGLLAGSSPAASPSTQNTRALTDRDDRQAEMPPFEPFVPEVEGRYRLLGTYALIRYRAQAQKRMVDAVIGHLKSEERETPNLVIDISATPWGDKQISSNIYCDGKPEDKAHRLSKLGPLVKGLLWVTAVNSYDFLLNLHAGVVTKGSKCVLLPAESGSGKSSLTAALTHSGYRYLSDEVGLIERGTFRVPAVPLAVCVKESGWELMGRLYPEIATLPIHRRNDGKIVRYIPPKPAAVQSEPALVSHIIFPRYVAGKPTRLEPLSRSAAFTRLMDQCVALSRRLDHDNVNDMIRWIAQIDCYALTFSSLEEAISIINGVVDRQ